MRRVRGVRAATGTRRVRIGIAAAFAVMVGIVSVTAPWGAPSRTGLATASETTVLATSTAPRAPTSTSAVDTDVGGSVPTGHTLPPPVDLLAVLDLIEVAPEHPEGYSRDLFGGWNDVDHDGCDTRQEVLIAESLTPAQVDIFGCAVVAGDWLSSYDGVTVGDPGEIDIDHVVALGEAWASGAWAWTAVQRSWYANDLTDPRTLAAVSASSNRSKGDRDPAHWLPRAADECRYVADWIGIKRRWHLSMDEVERAAILDLLQGPCSTVASPS